MKVVVSKTSSTTVVPIGSSSTTVVPIGSSGIPGKSAYQVALDNGFVGTESDWIDSLKGSSAYQVALDNGFIGTEAEWLESLKVGIEIAASDMGMILTNNGDRAVWVSIEQKLNESQLNWDLGEL